MGSLGMLLGRLPFSSALGEATASAAGSKGAFISQKFLGSAQRQGQAASGNGAPWTSGPRASTARLAIATPVDTERRLAARRSAAPELQVVTSFLEGSGSLPAAIYRLLDPAAPVELPPPGTVTLAPGDNRELDKLVAALGRNKSTWRRALALHDWLLQSGHRPDDRLTTTLIRVCSQHGQASTALSLYDWMRSQPGAGGAGLTPSVFTYTAAMRAALTGSMLDRAMQVWDDAVGAKCEIDCRLCTTLVEVCGRRGDTDRALDAYAQMHDAPRDSRMAPSVHAYTAAMRAAAEGGRWEAALSIWDDMQKAGCKPTGHAYAAVISACAAGGQWQRAVALFDDMLAWGVRPDVVSCTALITALGTDGQWERAEKVVEWMLRSDIKPNVRTYTALITALGNAKQWDRALEIVKRMRRHGFGGGLEPNAYTYSALLKTMGEQGKWQLAERFFRELETEQMDLMAKEAAAADAKAGRCDADGASASAAVPAAPVAAAAGSVAAAAVTPAVSAFPGMAKELPTEAPGANPEAIAAAAAAVAALAARQHQLAAAGGSAPALDLALLQQLAAAGAAVAAAAEEAESAGLRAIAASAAEAALATPRGGSAAAAAAPAFNLHHEQQQQQEGDAASFFSYFSGPTKTAPQPSGSPASVADAAVFVSPFAPEDLLSRPASQWTNDNAAVRGLSLHLEELSAPAAAVPAAAAAAAAAAPKLRPLPKGRGPVNEVVCGALMLAYERASKWQECVAVLERARTLGISPNTIMYNTAMSALGKALQAEAAAKLFSEMPAPDAVSYETLIAAHGMSGRAEVAEAAFKAMHKAGFTPRDYAYCGLIAAHSFQGDWRSALRVQERMQSAGVAPTVHVFNALIAACDRAHQYEKALSTAREMQRVGVPANSVTQALLEGVCKEGTCEVESQQAAAAALSAAVAAAGTLMIPSQQGHQQTATNPPEPASISCPARRVGAPLRRRSRSGVAVQAGLGSNLLSLGALSIEQAPPEAVLALGGVALLALGGIAYAAIQAQSGDTAGAEPAAPPPPLRENAVLVFGATGRMGRVLVDSLLAQGRTVIAATRSADCARDVLGKEGPTGTVVAFNAASAARSAGGAGGNGILFIEPGVDITNPDTLTPEIFKGVTQVVTSVGAVFGKTADGKMGYLDDMTPERVDAQGMANVAAAAAKYLPRAARETEEVLSMRSAEDIQRWQRLDDVIMGGQSESGLAAAEDGSGAVWRGDLIIEGGGFCGARTFPADLDLSAYDGICLRVKGDGQTFKLNIKTDMQIEKPEDTYQETFETQANGDWTTVHLPWHSFVLVKRARSVPDYPPLDPARIRQFGLVLSRFEYNGFPNPSYRPGKFELLIDGGIQAYTEPRPQLLMVSSAGVERNAKIGDDEEARKKDIPIVQLNPGAVLNHKYTGENAVRASGLSYCVLRSTGLTNESEPGEFLLEASQGDRITGRISREELASMVATALGTPAAAGKTAELRRQTAADAAGKSMSERDNVRLFLALAEDRHRPRVGLEPFPAPAPPPAPATAERKKEILSDVRVIKSLAAGRGGRVRDEQESATAKSITVTNDGREQASLAAAAPAPAPAAAAAPPPAAPAAAAAPAAPAGTPANVEEARAWIATWKAKGAAAAPAAAAAAAPAAAAAAEVPANVAAAREWIRKWRAARLEKQLPARAVSKQRSVTAAEL
ncbi:nadh:ubiquinone oxidoreductase complex i intermediate-associated 30 [Micractinium conductrix]|uniref:Nadh:ubiquinone oxidoreductase complex i intermediate-associated 30 n=1 Tax=Micractinium conductrix TaxID=554055 RepID=A0A2P6VBT4_9CHLO|nr:nadh:ubiquinone oxidoreductase complex i intermediate-associated 30 [Micractinium conductrix]|eukprot:PSC71557.1 nadh:ubiquinone oxidoreductase complex i intermediate-associated 30 [Micractinium conductrix]